MDAQFGPSSGHAPYDCRTLPVGQGHALYLEQSGNAQGIPVVYLHGGPGSGCHAALRHLFDPARFRVILFDQRGAGRSTPKRGLDHNTTPHLIADLERIRQALDIERWMVVGGSWGALLAVAYAQAYPRRVSGLALRALFLGTDEELDWAFIRGPQVFRPELWRVFIGLLPEAERPEPLAAYGDRLENPDPAVHGPAAQVWYAYERALSVLVPAKTSLPASLHAAGEPGGGSRGGLPNTPFFEWHYIKHGFFLTPDQLIGEAHRLTGIPGIVIQGRFDLLCPPVTAQRLCERWHDGKLRIVGGAGHDLGDPGISKALTHAIGELSEIF